MKNSIGEMRHQVVVENPTRTADAEGGYTDAWSAASPSPVWARLEPATPSNVERLVGNTVSAPITHVVTMRYHAGITAKTRLTFENSRVFYVRGLQNVSEKDRWLVLACEEIV